VKEVAVKASDTVRVLLLKRTAFGIAVKLAGCISDGLLKVMLPGEKIKFGLLGVIVTLLQAGMPPKLKSFLSEGIVTEEVIAPVISTRTPAASLIRPENNICPDTV
jgi:hypothetical protein